jgi:hypothetical protein
MLIILRCSILAKNKLMCRIANFSASFLFNISNFSAQTATEIIEMNLKARGGKEKILSLKNMKMECISNRQGMEFPLTLTFSHNQGFRMDMQIMGMDCFMLINNKAAYSYFPMRGQASPEAMPDEMHKQCISIGYTWRFYRL